MWVDSERRCPEEEWTGEVIWETSEAPLTKRERLREGWKVEWKGCLPKWNRWRGGTNRSLLLLDQDLGLWNLDRRNQGDPGFLTPDPRSSENLPCHLSPPWSRPLPSQCSPRTDPSRSRRKRKISSGEIHCTKNFSGIHFSTQIKGRHISSQCNDQWLPSNDKPFFVGVSSSSFHLHGSFFVRWNFCR